ncbi:MAG: glycogen-binding domain-containing protein [Limisphaerales bacterium]
MRSSAGKNKASAKPDSPENLARPVPFELFHPSAKSVFIAGTFNDWHPTLTEMIATSDCCWRKELTLRPGTYEYRLIVDGQWLADPRASDTAPNPFGGVNSVLRVSPAEGTEAPS